MIHSLLRSSTARVGSVALLALIVCGLAFAAITGSMTVTVTDKDGAPLPGATVKITGSSQLGERAAVTNDKGVVQFNAVTPGTYTVTVTMSGFGTINRPDVPVKLDQHSQVKLQMLEEKVEVVTVTGKTPTVDTQSTSTGTELSRQLVDSVPIPRDYLGNLSRVPGVGTGSNPSVRGATDRENMYLIDGVNTTDPVTSTFGTNINFDIIDQQQVTTGGLGVEYGGISGMVSNVITKSGGNNWSGTLTYFRQDPRWAWSPKQNALAGTSALTYNYAYTLGGPIIKDKLWHFTSYQKNLTEYTTMKRDPQTLQVVENGRPPRKFDGYLPFAKLTWQATSNHRFQAVYNQEETTIYNVNAGTTYVKPDQFYQQNQPSKLYSAKYTGILGSSLILEGQLNFFRNNLGAGPQFPGAGPNFRSYQNPIAGDEYGRYINEQKSNRDRDEFKLDASYFLPTGFGDHNLKVGIDYTKTSFGSTNHVSGNEGFTDWSWASGQAGVNDLWSLMLGGNTPNPLNAYYNWTSLARYNNWDCTIGGVACDQVDSLPEDPALWSMVINGTTYHPTDFRFDTLSLSQQAQAHTRRVVIDGVPTDVADPFYRMIRNGADPFSPKQVGSRVQAFYAQDEWKLNKLAVRAGVRIDKQKFMNSDGQTQFNFKTNVSPRFGVTYDPKGDGKSKIWGSFGILYDQLNDETSDFVGNTSTDPTYSQYWLQPLNGYYTYTRAEAGYPGALVSPNIKNPRTKEYMIGYSRDLGNELALELSAFDRRSTDLIEDFDANYGLYPDYLFPTLQGNPTLAGLGFKDTNGDGQVTFEDLPLTAYSSGGTAYLLYNPPGASRHAWGYDIVLNKRFANNWQGMLSYEYQKAEGNMETAFLARSVGDNAYMDPRLNYNYGPLSYARTHFLQAMASYTFKNRLTVGGEFRIYSGTHDSLYTTDIFGIYNIWNGDPYRVVRSLGISSSSHWRTLGQAGPNGLPTLLDQFAMALGVPAYINTTPNGTATWVDNRVNLYQAIMAQVPFDLRPGRGAYDQPWVWTSNLRVRYDLPVWKKVQSQFFVDVFNVTNRQAVTSTDDVLATKVAISTTNITDKNTYNYKRTLANQAPRVIQAGVRVQF